MTLKQAMFPPRGRTDGLERLDLLEWDEIDRAIQSVLQDLDAKVKRKYPAMNVKAGRNAARAWELFTYRVYRSAALTEIDPVVVGIVCATREETIEIHGDIVGELTGDVLFDAPAKEVVGKLGVLEAVRDMSELLSMQSDVVVEALGDARRRAE